MPSKDREERAEFSPISTWVRRVVDQNGNTHDQPTRYEQSTASSVATIMTRTTYCVKPEVGVDTLANLLLEQGVSGVPVVNRAGRAIGVVSKTDLLRHMQARQGGLDLSDKDEQTLLTELGAGFHSVHVDGTTVKDIMMPIVFALHQDALIVEAAAMMATERIHRLPIVDETGAVVGILTPLDIARWVAEEAGYPV